MASGHLVVVRARALAADRCHSHHVNGCLPADKMVH